MSPTRRREEESASKMAPGWKLEEEEPGRFAETAASYTASGLFASLVCRPDLAVAVQRIAHLPVDSRRRREAHPLHAFIAFNKTHPKHYKQLIAKVRARAADRHRKRAFSSHAPQLMLSIRPQAEEIGAHTCVPCYECGRQFAAPQAGGGGGIRKSGATPSSPSSECRKLSDSGREVVL